ncbi:MAG: hypothetical protein ACXVBB_13935, partial [Isosphaeraceae bacterium]
MDGWSFQDGGFIPTISPSGMIQHPIPHDGGISFFNIGPGLRQSICNRVDFGGAITWATDTAHWAQPWFRFEVRFLFWCRSLAGGAGTHGGSFLAEMGESSPATQTGDCQPCLRCRFVIAWPRSLLRLGDWER